MWEIKKTEKYIYIFFFKKKEFFSCGKSKKKWKLENSSYEKIQKTEK